MALNHRFHLTLGGAFKIFGFDLDRLRELDHRLNGERTRFVESYSFDRDRPVDIPASLGAPEMFQRTAFLAGLVSSWQEAVPIRSVTGRSWQHRDTVYARIGTRVGIGLPRVPPGSIIAIEPVSTEERLAPNPESVYFLQHGNAYLACACTVQNGRLFLITRNGSYFGRHDFLYPQEIRVVGRISGFSVGLPVSVGQTAVVLQGEPAPLILPWEHKSLHALIKAERTRLGITEAQVRRASEYLQSAFGVSISPRTLRRYEHLRRTLFCAGFSVRETIAADHDCNQTCDLSNGAREESLDGGKAGVEGGAALGMCGDREDEENKSRRPDVPEYFPNPLHETGGDCDSDFDLHLHLQQLKNQS
jgi:hypothetical protein